MTEGDRGKKNEELSEKLKEALQTIKELEEKQKKVSVPMVPSSFQAGIVRGKVTSIRGKVMELDLGIEKGIQVGDSGRAGYNILIQGKGEPIFIAQFKITRVSDKSSTAEVEKKTAEVKVGHLVEVSFKAGELELSSDPAEEKFLWMGRRKERRLLSFWM